MDWNQFKLMSLIGKLFGADVTPRQIGGGVQRAQERLAAKRKANQKMYGHLPERPPSRQVNRATARRILKQERSALKSQAMRNKVVGGSAVVT